MSDNKMVLVAVAAALGASVAEPISVAAVVAVAFAAVLLRSPVVIIVTAAAVTSSLSAHWWHRLERPLPDRVGGTAEIVSLPERYFDEVRVEVSLRSRRYVAVVPARRADHLIDAGLGSRVHLSGWTSTLPESRRAFLRRRHIAGVLRVEKAGRVEAGSLFSRSAAFVRDRMEKGLARLPPESEGLALGLVLGDDRKQTPETIGHFRETGLTHLLVVSGQNVAFVVALFSPVLLRLGIERRSILASFIVMGFVLVVGLDPSILRAAAMSIVTTMSMGAGRPVSRLRALALAVAATLLIDPFLVGSLGYQLSVSACVGMTLLTEGLQRRIPGPRPLRSALATTVSAELGVLPVLLAAFGTVPSVAVPANLLVAPVAGITMMAGTALSALGGALPPPLGRLVVFPLRPPLAWMSSVARWGSMFPVTISVFVATILVALCAFRYWTAPRSKLRSGL